MLFYKALCGMCLTIVCATGLGQRAYKPNSVLASGNWYKIGVVKDGVYRLDVAFLNSMGINTSALSSASIRMFSNNPGMLAEANAGWYIDDLVEIPIMVSDGGDGLFNSNDQVFFYGSASHIWKKDSVNKRFTHETNIYSDTCYYFLTIGSNGSRIPDQPSMSQGSVIIGSYNDRLFHELDTINLLSSGKEWFGEEFMDAPGKTLNRTFNFSLPGIDSNTPILITSDCIARSVNVASRFDVQVNNAMVQQITIPAAGNGQYDKFAHQMNVTSTAIATSPNVSINYTYVPGGFNSQGWLNYFELHARRKLDASGGQLLFRDWNSIGNHIGKFSITANINGLIVWDITDPLSPIRIQGTQNGSQYEFNNDCSRLREYIAFNNANAFIPVSKSVVQNQNIHASSFVDHIIVSHVSLMSEAERLAAFHRARGLRVLVVSSAAVFNEFSAGRKDPVAIRNMIKMFYDRATLTGDKPKTVLFFGDASFDPKNRVFNNTDLVPSYESGVSLDPLGTYVSDDFFGFLDDNEDINSGLVTTILDVGIGRIPARNANEAKNIVDKVYAYHSSESFGPWRTNLTLIADDEDLNLHLEDAETIASTVTSNNLFNQQKIYFDAFQQTSTPAGERYPAVNDAINGRMFNGTLIWNYSGHGGAQRLAEETVVDKNSIPLWKNKNRLPLLVTATCDVAPFDNPFINSLGEEMIFRQNAGAIALMTTTRLVFAASNRIMNEAYMRHAIIPDMNGIHKTLGEAVRVAKNELYQSVTDVTNNRKFTLLGDPAMTLGFPRYKIKTTSINGISAGDTLNAGEHTVIEGEVTDHNGNLINAFNGTVYPVVFDKPVQITTKGNDATSLITTFNSFSTVLFRGKATVSNGKFRFEFKVPKDINYSFGKGRLSYYADDGNTDAGDADMEIMIGGGSAAISNDREGPVISAWINDKRFVNGSMVNESPVLILELADSSGINTSGMGVGHDISVMIDNDNSKFYVMNDNYEADVDDFRKGTVRFQLPVLSPGLHSLKVRAWDTMNNSSEIIIELTVANDEKLVITRVLNYPNPFTTRTQFWFEHNRPGEDLFVQIHIYSLSGRIIRTLEKTINTTGNRSIELEWNARDEFGDRVARGVYIYRIVVQSRGIRSKSVIEKLVVL